MGQSGWVITSSPKKVPGPLSAEMQSQKRENLRRRILLAISGGAENRVEPCDPVSKRTGHCFTTCGVGSIVSTYLVHFSVAPTSLVGARSGQRLPHQVGASLAPSRLPIWPILASRRPHLLELDQTSNFLIRSARLWQLEFFPLLLFQPTDLSML
uniref:Uncharacterized protein n=1 Tax=Manihot esculenta TaxID=3983 RepID=A0A2C9VAA1_MANES